MKKYSDLPTHALIYQHSEAVLPWAIEIERTSEKKPRQSFKYRIYSEALPGFSTDWLTIANLDLHSTVSNICNCVRVLGAACDGISSCSEDYAHIHWQIEKFFYTW